MRGPHNLLRLIRTGATFERTGAMSAVLEGLYARWLQSQGGKPTVALWRESAPSPVAFLSPRVTTEVVAILLPESRFVGGHHP